jgi:hypothetical protein
MWTSSAKLKPRSTTGVTTRASCYSIRFAGIACDQPHTGRRVRRGFMECAGDAERLGRARCYCISTRHQRVNCARSSVRDSPGSRASDSADLDRGSRQFRAEHGDDSRGTPAWSRADGQDRRTEDQVTDLPLPRQHLQLSQQKPSSREEHLSAEHRYAFAGELALALPHQLARENPAD